MSSAKTVKSKSKESNAQEKKTDTLKKQIKSLQDQLELKIDIEDQYEDLNDKYIRLKAEFANYKKRTDKEREELGTFIRSELIKSLLPIKDDFDRLIEHTDEDKTQIVEGIELIAKKVDQFLEQNNVKKIDSVGEEFDPEFHEALMMQPVEDEEQDHRVLQVFEEGYIIADKVIRHAKVMVGKK